MRKWLVGLVAAGLCAASAWAASYSWVKSADALTEGNYVILAGQGDSAMKNVADDSKRISAEDVEVTGDVVSNPDASLVWTLAKGDDGWIISSETTNGTVYAAAPSKAENKSRLLTELDGNYTLWSFGDSKDTDLIAVKSLQYTDRFLQKNNSGSYFCCYTGTQKDVRFFKEDSGEFSVALDPAADFAVVEGAEATVTATAKNALGDVTYAWTVDGTPAETDGPELALPTGTVGGPYEVVCVATDTGADGVTATASVSYTVTAAPQAYTVTIDSDIENGSVVVRDGETELVSGAEVLEGTVLTAVAIPASRSFKVESLTVTGAVSGAIEVAEDGTFTMPGENVTVSATFAPWEGTVYALVESMDDFEAGADYLVVAHKDGEYTSALKNEYQSESDGRIAVEEVEIIDDTVETEDDSIVWTIAAGTAEGSYTLFNAAAGVYVAAPSTESANAAQLLDADSAAADVAQWTLAFTNGDAQATIGSIYAGKSLQRNNNSNNKFFANYKGGTKPYLFKKVGAGVFSVALDPATDFEVIQDEEASIAATPKNAVGEVTYAWTVDGVAAETDGPVLALSTGVVGGPHEVVCVATDAGRDGETATASVSYTVVAVPALYMVSIADDIENGEVSINLDGTPVETPIELLEGTGITVVATPATGFKLEAITVNGTPIEGDTFVLAEDSEISATFVESSTVTATYTVESTSAVSVSGPVPEDSEAVYASTYGTKYQLVAGSSMTLTLKGYEGATITGLTLSMKSNKSSGAGSLRAECGDAVIGAIADAPFSDESWNGEYSQEYVDIKVPVTATRVDGDVVITLAASVKSLYCQSFTVEYEPGEPVFSVGFDKEDGFTVDAGTADSITAIAKNGEGEITYAWYSETPDLNGSGPVLEIPGTLEPGGYAVRVTATDSSDEPQTATADISFEVVAPIVKFQVEVAVGIPNGSVAADKTEAEAGELVTLSAEPAEGYKLDTFLLDGEPIPGDSFEMPAKDVLVSAEFSEIVKYQVQVAIGIPNGSVTADKTEAEPGETVTLSAEPAEGYRLGTFLLDGEPIGGNSFEMPEGDVLVSAQFVEDTSVSATYTVMSTTEVETTGTAPEGSSAAYETTYTTTNQLTKGNSMTLTLSGYEGATITGLTLSMRSNSGGGAGSLGVECGDAVIASIPDSRFNSENWYGEWSTEYVDVTVPVTATYIDGNVVITLAASANSLYCRSFTVTYEAGEPPFAVGFDKEDGFTVDAGSADSITATARNGVEPYDYAWASETPELGGSGPVLEIPDSLEPGEYAVTVTATDSSDEPQTATASISFEVVVPVAKYQIEVAVGIPNGSVAADKAEAEEGELVTLSAEPADGWKLGTFLLDGEPISGDSFEMPAHDVLVSAEFVEFTGGTATYTVVSTSEVEATGDVPAGSTAAYESTYGTACQLTGGNSMTLTLSGYESATITGLTLSMKSNKGGGAGSLRAECGDAVIGAIANASFADETWHGEYSTEYVDIEVPVTATYIDGDVVITLAATANSLYCQSFTVAYELGEPPFTVGFDKEDGFTVEQGSADSITAIAKNGVGDVSYIWTSPTEALSGEGATLAIPGTLEAGVYAVTVTATDSADEPRTATADISFEVVAPATKYQVEVAIGIPNGSVAADKAEAEEGELVTLSAEAADGYKLGTFLLDGEPIGGDSFEMPAHDVLVSAEFVEFTGGTATYTVVSTNAVEATGDVPAGSGAAYESTYGSKWQLTADNSMTLTLTGYEGTTITGLTLSMRSNSKSGAGSLRAECGDAIIGAIADASFADESWNGEYSQEYVDIEVPVEATYIDDDVVITLAASANSLYCRSFTVAYTVGEPPFTVGFDKEDGFTVEQGTADSITATALRGTEPYSYAWTGDLEGEGATLAIPGTLEAGTYSVTVTATDSADEPRTATADISFEVVAPATKYSITIDPAIVGGTVVADKETAAAGETVTLTVTPDPDFILVAIFVNGDEITETSFPMPAEDVVVSAGFAEVVDYATLPFIDKDTPYSGPWKTAEIPGLTNEGLDSDYDTGGVYGAKFRTAGSWMQVKFRGTPGTLSFGIKGNGVSETNVSTFVVQESADGETWTPVATFTSDDNLTNSRQDVSYTLSEGSQYVKFLYETKGTGNVGIYDVYIGEAGEPEATVTVTGETTLKLGGTFALELALENYTGEYTWAWAPETVGYVDPDTATWWWTPTQVGETEVTFSAMDGDRTIASATGTLTVLGEPALVFGGDDEGTVGTPVNFTVAAEYVADPTVTFKGFLDVPEGSSLTDADVVLDFPNVTFTPDAAGEYGLAFSAGTEGVDYVEDVWIVTVAPAPAEPEVTLLGGETTVELGGDFLLQFALSNYEGAFTWTADVGEIDEDGYFTWTPTEAGEFPVVVSAVSGEETIASTTVTLTVTGEPPVPVPVEITQMEFDTAAGIVTLTFTGNGVVVEGTDDLNGMWEPLEALIEGDTAIVRMTKRFIRVR